VNQERKPWQPPAEAVDGPPIQASNLIGGTQKPSQLVISGESGLTLATIGVDELGVLHVQYDPDNTTEAARRFFDGVRVLFGRVGARGPRGIAWADGARAAADAFAFGPDLEFDKWVSENNPWRDPADDLGHE